MISANGWNRPFVEQAAWLQQPLLLSPLVGRVVRVRCQSRQPIRVRCLRHYSTRPGHRLCSPETTIWGRRWPNEKLSPIHPSINPPIHFHRSTGISTQPSIDPSHRFDFAFVCDRLTQPCVCILCCRLRQPTVACEVPADFD